MATGFNYPESPHARRHGPQGYATYDSFRPWLRDEFCFRCVYCLLREQWCRAHGEFHLDHFTPQGLDPQQAADYDNVLYACVSCNIGKGEQVVPDPTLVLTVGQVIVYDDGAIDGLTKESERLIRMLDLDDEDYRRWRRTWIRILELAQRYDPPLYQQLMGFPEDLPDLARLRPPGGNGRPAGIEESYLEQRNRGALASEY